MTPLGPVRVPVPTAHTRARTHKVCVCARVWERETDLMLPMPPSLIHPFHDTQGMDGTARTRRRRGNVQQQHRAVEREAER